MQRGRTQLTMHRVLHSLCAGTASWASLIANGSRCHRRSRRTALAPPTWPSVRMGNTRSLRQRQRATAFVATCSSAPQFNLKRKSHRLRRTVRVVLARRVLRATAVHANRSAPPAAPPRQALASARPVRQDEQQPPAAHRAPCAQQGSSAQSPVRSAQRAQLGISPLARAVRRALRGGCAPRGTAWPTKAHWCTIAGAHRAWRAQRFRQRPVPTRARE